MINETDVMQALQKVTTPAGQSLPVSGAMSPPIVRDGKVIVSINVDATDVQAWDAVRKNAEAALRALPGIVSVMVALTAERRPGAPMPKASSSQPQPAKPRPQAPHGSPMNKQAPIAGVAHVIAVASGKGGVGKSTTALNLALGLHAQGLKVGLLDADIYGPSVPRLTGIYEKPQTRDGKTMLPIERFGLSIMSIGFLVAEETPMVWRGPMIMSALTQMLREVDWGTLDVLVVDMPPGTGDAQLTLAQNVPLSGAVIVSTPQDLALIDARRGIAMFGKVDVPVLGIVENMSYFLCPHCGTRSDIFGHGGAEHEAEKLGVPFLGAVPLHMQIRETSDSGQPVVASDPKGPHALIYLNIAQAVRDRLAKTAAPA